jgi:hypothetical protein
MIAFLSLFSCKLGDNLPPRFERINGEEVKYLLGAPYSVFFEEYSAKRGDVIELEIEVRDPNGDDVQLLFPNSPPGLDFKPDERTGTLSISEDPTAGGVSLSVLAVDERGASSWISLSFYIDDFKEDTGDFLSFFSNGLYGEGGIEEGYSGWLVFESELLPCRWQWPEVSGPPIDTCASCEAAWLLQLGVGQALAGDCSMVEEELNLLEELRVGWAPHAELDGVEYLNPVFYYDQERGWLPNGRGLVQDGRFEFSVDMHY